MDVGFSVGSEEGEPILFNGGAGGRGVAGQFGEGWVGFQGTEGGISRGGGQEVLERRM